MLHIAHIINPVQAGVSSDLHTAQPVTFESMKRAKDFAAEKIKDTVVSGIQAGGQRRPGNGALRRVGCGKRQETPFFGESPKMGQHALRHEPP